jgi:DNA invertase Pin-like site-specific DNA recombinase
VIDSSPPFLPGTRLVAYLRDSGGPDQEYSIAQQQSVIAEYCKANGLVLTREFIDSARSGTSVVGRDEFLHMIEYLNGEVPERGVVLWAYSRFSRDYDQFQHFISGLRYRGYEVFSMTDNVPEGLEGRLLEGIYAYSNAAYSKRLSTDVKRGLDYVFRQHHAHIGPTPVGFKAVQVEIGKHRDGSQHVISQLAVDEAKAPLVRQAYAMRAGGGTLNEIHAATHLFSALTSYGDLLHNPVYIGQRGDIEGYCPAIIDADVWEAAQDINRQRKAQYNTHHPRTVRSRFYLTGLLRCGECGHNMAGQDNHINTYYRCVRVKEGTGGCHAHLIPKASIEQRVIDALKEHVLVEQVCRDVYEAGLALAQQEDATRADAVKRARAEIVANAASVNRIVSAIAETGHSAAMLAALVKLEDEGDELRLRLAKAETAKPAVIPEIDIPLVLAQITQLIDEGTPEEIRDIVRGVVKSVTAVKELRGNLSGEVTFLFPVPGVNEEITVPL